MRSIHGILLGVVVALATASLAHAETPAPNPSTQAGDFAQFAQVRLGDKFEKSVGVVSDLSLGGLGGPSSMRCAHSLTGEQLDTCVVTAEGAPGPVAPAALAHN